MATGNWGHQINPEKSRYATAAETITLPDPRVALGVVYSAAFTVRLPDADGELPAGVVWEKSAASGDVVNLSTGELALMVAAEAITAGQVLMLDNATGYVLVATTGKYILGRALTAQSTVGGWVLVEINICLNPLP